MARAGDRTEKNQQPNWRDRHMDSCSECAAFFDAAEAITAELRESAPSNPGSIPEGLEGRIWAAVEADQSTEHGATPKRVGVGGWRTGFALAGIAFIAVFFAWSPNSSDPDSAAIAHSDFSEEDMKVLVAQIGDFSSTWLGTSPSEDDGLKTSPLAEELDALEADASAALRFLERSFLPMRRSAS